jgi:hypothetical protein
MNKFIIVDYIYNYKKNKSIEKYVNETENECLICYSTLTWSDVVMENHFCDCYHILLLCGKCFKNWYINDTRCIICRNKYMTYNENETDNIFKISPIIRYKYSLKCKGYDNILNKYLVSRSIIIPDANGSDDTDGSDDTEMSSEIDEEEDIENTSNQSSNQSNNETITNITSQTNNDTNNNLCIKYNENLIIFCGIMITSSMTFIITYLYI